MGFFYAAEHNLILCYPFNDLLFIDLIKKRRIKRNLVSNVFVTT